MMFTVFTLVCLLADAAHGAQADSTDSDSTREAEFYDHLFSIRVESLRDMCETMVAHSHKHEAEEFEYHRRQFRLLKAMNGQLYDLDDDILKKKLSDYKQALRAFIYDDSALRDALEKVECAWKDACKVHGWIFKDFTQGQQVQLLGLKATRHNGKVGTIVKEMKSKGRWKVQLDNGKYDFKPENITERIYPVPNRVRAPMVQKKSGTQSDKTSARVRAPMVQKKSGTQSDKPSARVYSVRLMADTPDYRAAIVKAFRGNRFSTPPLGSGPERVAEALQAMLKDRQKLLFIDSWARRLGITNEEASIVFFVVQLRWKHY